MDVRLISRKERYQEVMHDSSFQILYIGEDLAWSKISTSLNDTARFNLKIHRAQSLNELFLILAGGTWHAAAIDIEAWKFQGLHYVEKIRSEYPSLPIVALYSAQETELPAKAKTSGASRCLPIDQLTPDSLHIALLTCLSEKPSQPRARKASPMQVTFNIPDSATVASSKNQVISHALNNLLCVITANADVLAEHVGATGPGVRSLVEIKRAAKSASDLMRLLK